MKHENRDYYKYIVAFILFMGLAIRLSHVKFGLPYKWADDAKIFYFSNIMLYERDVIPEYFMYSSISMYIQSIVMLAIGWISKLLVLLGFSTSIINDIATTFLATRTINYQLQTEFAYYSVLLGRAVFATIGLFSGYFVYKILRRCTGSYFISIVGLILNIFLLIQFQCGIVLRQENLSLFFLAAMAYYTIVFYDNPSKRRALGLGGISALCLTIEYSLAPVILLPVVIYSLIGIKNKSKWSITDKEIKYRFRQLMLLLIIFLALYCIFVTNIATKDKDTLLYFWGMRYRLGGLIIATSLLLSAIVYIIYRFSVKDSKRVNRYSQAIINSNFIPYYFLYGFLPILIIFNMGLFVKFLDYGRQVFIYLLSAYTKSFRIYTLTTPQMLRQVGSYIFNEQMGYIYTFLILLLPLIFLNRGLGGEKRHRITIIIAFVFILLSFFTLFLHLFHTHRFIAISSLQVCVVMLSLFNIYLFLKRKNSIIAYIVVILLVLSGAYPHLNRIAKLSKFARTSDTRTLAAGWLSKNATPNDVIVIDKALFMDSIDLKRNNLNVVFYDVDKDLIFKLNEEKLEPRFIVTTNRKIYESEFDEINKAIRRQFVYNELIYFPLYHAIFRKSFFDLNFLQPKFQLKKIFIKKQKIGPLLTLYDPWVRTRVSIIRKGETPSIVCNPDILIFQQREDV